MRERVDDVTSLNLSTAYGLLFASDAPLPEFLPVDFRSGQARTPDVTVVHGHVPERLDSAVTSGRYHEVSEQQFLLRVPDVGRYLVTGGDRIVVDPLEGVSAQELRVFVLGTCMGVLLNQRGFLVLHASGIATERGAVLFSGHSGAGKSTLLNAMLRRGYPMVVDDVCAVEASPDGLPVVIPAYPRTRLWADSADRFAIDTEGLVRTRPTMEKFEIQVPEGFSAVVQPLVGMVVLTSSPGAELELVDLPAFEAFTTVVAHTYRGLLLDDLRRRPAHFELASLVTRAATVTVARRPSDAFRLDELADLVAARVGPPR